MRFSWRDDMRPRIAAVIKRVGTADMKALRRALNAAFPYGDVSWQRKVWRDEIKVQLGLKQAYQPGPRLRKPAPGQTQLFTEGE